MIERYGEAGEVLLAVHSPEPRPAEVTVTPNWEALGIDPPGSVIELLSGVALTVSEGAVTVSLDPRSTAVLVLR